MKYTKSYYIGKPKNEECIFGPYGFIIKRKDELYRYFYDYSDFDYDENKEHPLKYQLLYSERRLRRITKNKTYVSNCYQNKEKPLNKNIVKVFDRIYDLFERKNPKKIIYSDVTVAFIRFIYKGFVYEINPYTFNLQRFDDKFYDEIFIDEKEAMKNIIKEELKEVEHIFSDARLFENNKHYH